MLTLQDTTQPIISSPHIHCVDTEGMRLGLSLSHLMHLLGLRRHTLPCLMSGALRTVGSESLPVWGVVSGGST